MGESISKILPLICTIMKKEILYFIPLLLVSCNPKAASEFKLELDPRNSLSNNILLSDFADKIFYLQLDNSIPITYLSQIKIYSDKIFINAKDVGVIKYDRAGGQATQIGELGMGPGEYRTSNAYTIDNINKQVCILNSGSEILKFNFNGKYLKKIQIKELGSDFDQIDMLGDYFLLSEYIKFGKARYNWVILDTLGNIVLRKMNPIPDFKSIVGISGGTSGYQNHTYYWNVYNDTVYSISHKLITNVLFTFGQGNFRFPVTEYDNSKMSSFFFLRNLIETKEFFFLEYVWNSTYFAVIDKKTMTLKAREVGISFSANALITSGGMLNDLDNRADFLPTAYFNDGREYLVGWNYPDQLRLETTTHAP